MAIDASSSSFARSISSSGCDPPSRNEKFERQCSSAYALVKDALHVPLTIAQVVEDEQQLAAARELIIIAFDRPLPPGLAQTERTGTGDAARRRLHERRRIHQAQRRRPCGSAINCARFASHVACRSVELARRCDRLRALHAFWQTRT